MATICMVKNLILIQVYRHAFQKSFQLEFTISLGEEQEMEVGSPISLIEVNGRTSFSIRGDNIEITDCSEE